MPALLFLHPIYIQSIAFLRVAYQYMRDCSDELSVLEDRTAAHSLHNAAGFFKQSFVSYLDYHALCRSYILLIGFYYINLIFLYTLSVYGC